MLPNYVATCIRLVNDPMAYHMLAIFDRETARAPTGLESYKSLERPHMLFPDELPHSEEMCNATLERAYSASKPERRHMEKLGGHGGFAFEATPFCSYAHRKGVHVLFGGEVSDWPGISAVDTAHDAFMRNVEPPEKNDAHWLLDFYDSFITPGAGTRDIADTALECLSQVMGAFAWVIYDETAKRVFAARDREGAQPLFWGTTEEGQLLFGSRVEDLEGCDPSATPFPAGTLFASERHTVAYSPGNQGWVINEDDWPGQVFSFIKEGTHWRKIKVIPRMTPAGVLCGAVYKVASAHTLPYVQ